MLVRIGVDYPHKPHIHLLFMALSSEFSGTPEGGVVSPVLSNLFLHYVFDKWMGEIAPSEIWEVLMCQSKQRVCYTKSYPSRVLS